MQFITQTASLRSIGAMSRVRLSNYDLDMTNWIQFDCTRHLSGDR